MADNYMKKDEVLKKLSEQLKKQNPANILDFMIEFLENEKEQKKMTRCDFSKNIQPSVQCTEKKYKNHEKLQYADPFQIECKVDKMKKTYNSFKGFEKKLKGIESARISSVSSTKGSVIANDDKQTYQIVDKAIQAIKQQQIQSQNIVDNLTKEINQFQINIQTLTLENEKLQAKEINCFKSDLQAQDQTSTKTDQQYSVKGNILYLKKDNYKYQQQTQQQLIERQKLQVQIEKEKYELFDINKQLALKKIIYSQNQNEIDELKINVNQKSKLVPNYIQKNKNLKNTKNHIIHKCEDIINELQDAN